jgi:hypothetical protein
MEKGPNVITEQKPSKLIGAMKHLLLELQKVGAINEIDRDHLIDRYMRGHINSFGQLAEWLHAFHMVENHNYIQILRYGNYYGELNYLHNSKGEVYLLDPERPLPK